MFAARYSLLGFEVKRRTVSAAVPFRVGMTMLMMVMVMTMVVMVMMMMTKTTFAMVMVMTMVIAKKQTFLSCVYME